MYSWNNNLIKKRFASVVAPFLRTRHKVIWSSGLYGVSLKIHHTEVEAWLIIDDHSFIHAFIYWLKWLVKQAKWRLVIKLWIVLDTMYATLWDVWWTEMMFCLRIFWCSSSYKKKCCKPVSELAIYKQWTLLELIQ